MVKVSLQTNLEKNLSNSSYILLLYVNFEKNLTIGLDVLYIFNTHIKFHSNKILFTIRSIKLFLCIILYHKNLKFKHFIDDMAIDL